jgi:hypothetical protein
MIASIDWRSTACSPPTASRSAEPIEAVVETSTPIS